MSDLRDNLKKLTAGGKGKEAHQYLAKEAGSMHGVYDQIRSNQSLSDAGKRREIAAAYTGMRVRVDREIAKRAARVVTSDRSDAGKVIGIDGLPGDSASLVISRRDASDRVEHARGRQALLDLLRRATRSGDEVLARAVAEKALENLDETVMNAFLEDRPDLDAAANRLWNARASEDSGMGATLHIADLYPSEFFGSDDDYINDVAQGVKE